MLKFCVQMWLAAVKMTTSSKGKRLFACQKYNVSGATPVKAVEKLKILPERLWGQPQSAPSPSRQPHYASFWQIWLPFCGLD